MWALPIYVISMGARLRSAEQLSAQPHAVVDWSRAEAGSQQIVQASGGRLYSPGSALNLSGVYDDMMENLRLRYVITYNYIPRAASFVGQPEREEK